jgi:hypothetical protein
MCPAHPSRNKEAMRLSACASILHRGRPELQGLGTRTAYSRKEQSDLERIDKAMRSMETWYGTLTRESVTAPTRKKVRRTSVGLSLPSWPNWPARFLCWPNPTRGEATRLRPTTASASLHVAAARPARGAAVPGGSCRREERRERQQGREGPLLWFPGSHSL